jgi:hypothetical protein
MKLRSGETVFKSRKIDEVEWEHWTVEQFLTLFHKAVATIKEPRLFNTERGYQGALIHELKSRIAKAEFPGDPIVEQEYQKTLPHHGINIRPDLIIHIPFERGVTQHRDEGNFAAVEIKLGSTERQADQDFASLELMKERLGYPITIFLNIGSSKTYAERCPASIAKQTTCFAVRLKDGELLVLMERCG